MDLPSGRGCLRWSALRLDRPLPGFPFIVMSRWVVGARHFPAPAELTTQRRPQRLDGPAETPAATDSTPTVDTRTTPSAPTPATPSPCTPHCSRACSPASAARARRASAGRTHVGVPRAIAPAESPPAGPRLHQFEQTPQCFANTPERPLAYFFRRYRPRLSHVAGISNHSWDASAHEAAPLGTAYVRLLGARPAHLELPGTPRRSTWAPSPRRG